MRSIKLLTYRNGGYHDHCDYMRPLCVHGVEFCRYFFKLNILCKFSTINGLINLHSFNIHNNNNKRP